MKIIHPSHPRTFSTQLKTLLHPETQVEKSFYGRNEQFKILRFIHIFPNLLLHMNRNVLYNLLNEKSIVKFYRDEAL